jgi:MFS transporter, FSR family, fosmidomycin resistance protein
VTRADGDAMLAPLALGVIHALVDLACAFVLFRDLDAYGAAPDVVAAWIVVYDTLAFAAQVPLGLLADRLSAYRALTFVGIAVVGAALGVGPLMPGTAAVIAGVGNALFHVGAGAYVLRACGSGARAIGLFVGPGAIGLCLGILWGRGEAAYRLPIAVALVLGFAAATWAMSRGGAREANHPDENHPTLAAPAWLCFSLLLLTVTLRSAIGDNVVSGWRARSVAVVIALAIAAAAGKMLGGVLADKLGWVRVAGVSLLLAAPFVAIGRLAPAAAVVGMLLLQVTTPLTLKALHRLLPERPGLAFGIPSAALLLGAAPGLADVWVLPVWSALLAATLLSAVVVVAGLRLLGSR